MLVRATTKNYNQVVAELVGQIRQSDRTKAGDATESFLASQTSGSRYWPDDAEIRVELDTLLAYRRLGRGRLRMVLEAIEDYQRGWRNGKAGLGDERVTRGKLAIEHVMPRRWLAHWPLQVGSGSETDRDHLIHTLGNLTLLTGKLNSKVSNAPWMGNGGKREGLEAHDVLLLNRDLIRNAGESWSDDSIRARTRELIEIIIKIWAVPAGHRSGFSPDRPRHRNKIVLSDLISGGYLDPGLPLFRRGRKLDSPIATLLADGSIEVNGTPHSSPTEAAKAITGRIVSGWWFFLVDKTSHRSLKNVRHDYISAMNVDEDDDEADDDGEDDES